MASPVLQQLTNTALTVDVVFDIDIAVDGDVREAFSVTADGVKRTVRSVEVGDDSIALTVDPIFAGQTVLVSFDNASPVYVTDGATETDPATSFTAEGSTNNSEIQSVSSANSAVYTPEVVLVDGTATAKVEVELGRDDRRLISWYGKMQIVTSYVHQDSVPVSGSPAEVGDGTSVTAVLSVSEDPLGRVAAVEAWQTKIRDNILTALIQLRELDESVGLQQEQAFQL